MEDFEEASPDSNHSSHTGDEESSGTSSYTEMLAEVVLLTSSLGGLKKQLFESARAQHLLDCKGLVYYIVDANKDLSNATEWKDYELYESWKSEGILRLFKDDSGNDSVVLPQVIIDGVSIGDQKFLQDLEDDGDLDYIVARLICPNCLCDKETEEVSCPKCKIEYRNIIPEEYNDNNYVRKLCQGLPCE